MGSRGDVPWDPEQQPWVPGPSTFLSKPFIGLGLGFPYREAGVAASSRGLFAGLRNRQAK